MALDSATRDSINKDVQRLLWRSGLAVPIEKRIDLPLDLQPTGLGMGDFNSKAQVLLDSSFVSIKGLKKL